MPTQIDLVANQKITLGVRPEHLSLFDQGMPAKVRVVEPTGSEIHVVFQCQDQDVTAIFRDRSPLSPGDHVHLTLDMDHVHLFDGETGVRMG